MSATSCDVTKIQDEDILRKMWQETEDFGRKKEIRAHMYKLREARLRDFYNTESIDKDIRRTHSSTNMREQRKVTENTHHADSLLDHSFLSLKSKEIRDSESPTRDITFKINDKLSTDKGWTIRETNERSQDGKTHTTNRLATTSGSEPIDRGVSNYSAKNEQNASVYQDGDDRNFVKSVGASNRSVIQQEARGGDDNSNFYSTSTTTKSSSKFVSEQKSSSDGFRPPQQIVRKSYDTNIPEEFKRSPNYVEGKTKVFTETKTLPDGSTVTTTRYETVGGSGSCSTTKKQVTSQQHQNVSSRQTLVNKVVDEGNLRSEHFVIRPNIEIRYTEDDHLVRRNDRDENNIKRHQEKFDRNDIRSQTIDRDETRVDRRTDREEIRNQTIDRDEKRIDRRTDREEIRKQQTVDRDERHFDRRIDREEIRKQTTDRDDRRIDREEIRKQTTDRDDRRIDREEIRNQTVDRDERHFDRRIDRQEIRNQYIDREEKHFDERTSRDQKITTDNKTIHDIKIRRDHTDQREQVTNDQNQTFRTVTRRTEHFDEIIPDDQYKRPSNREEIVITRTLPSETIITKKGPTQTVVTKTTTVRTIGGKVDDKKTATDFINIEKQQRIRETDVPTPQDHQKPVTKPAQSSPSKIYHDDKPKDTTPIREIPIEHSPRKIYDDTKPTAVKPSQEPLTPQSPRKVCDDKPNKQIPHPEAKKPTEYTQPERRQPIRQKPEMDTHTTPTDGQYQTTYRTEFVNKKITMDVSPTHDAFARSLRSVTPERDRKSGPPSLRTSTSSLRSSISPEKNRRPETSPKKNRHSPDSRDGSPRKTSPEKNTYPIRPKTTPEKNKHPERSSPDRRGDVPRNASPEKNRYPETSSPDRRGYTPRNTSPEKSRQPLRSSPDSPEKKRLPGRSTPDRQPLRSSPDKYHDSPEKNRHPGRSTPDRRDTSPRKTTPASPTKRQPSPLTRKTSTETITRKNTYNTDTITRRKDTEDIDSTTLTRRTKKNEPPRSRSSSPTDTVSDFEYQPRPQITDLDELVPKERQPLDEDYPGHQRPDDNNYPEDFGHPGDKQPHDIQKNEEPYAKGYPKSGKPGDQDETIPATTKKPKKITERSPTSPLKQTHSPTKDTPRRSSLRTTRPPTMGSPTDFKPFTPKNDTEKVLRRTDTYEERCRQILGIPDTTKPRKPSLPDVARNSKSPEKRVPSQRRPSEEVPRRATPEEPKSPRRPVQTRPKSQTPDDKYARKPSPTKEPEQMKKTKLTKPMECPTQTQRTPDRHSPTKPHPYDDESPRKSTKIQEFPAQIRKSPERRPKEEYPTKDKPVLKSESPKIQEFPSQSRKTPEKKPREPYPTKDTPVKSESPKIQEFPSQIRKSPERRPKEPYPIKDKPCKPESLNIQEFPSQIRKTPEEILRKPSDLQGSPTRKTPQDYDDGLRPSGTPRPESKSPSKKKKPSYTHTDDETTSDEDDIETTETVSQKPKPKVQHPRRPEVERTGVTTIETTEEYTRYPLSDDDKPKKPNVAETTTEVVTKVTTKQTKQTTPTAGSPDKPKPVDMCYVKHPGTKPIEDNMRQPIRKPKQPDSEDYEVIETVTTEEYITIDGKKQPKKVPGISEHPRDDTTEVGYQPKSKRPISKDYDVTEIITTQDDKKQPKKPEQPKKITEQPKGKIADTEDNKITETVTTDEYIIVDGKRQPKKGQPGQPKPDDRQPKHPSTDDYEVIETVTTEEYITVDGKRIPKKLPGKPQQSIPYEKGPKRPNTEDEPKKVTDTDDYEDIETITTEECITIDEKRQPKKLPEQPKTDDKRPKRPSSDQPKKIPASADYDVVERITTEQLLTIDGTRRPTKLPGKPDQPKKITDTEDYDVVERITTEELFTIGGKGQPKKPEQPRKTPVQPKSKHPDSEEYKITETVTREESIIVDGKRQPKKPESRTLDDKHPIRPTSEGKPRKIDDFETITTEEYVTIDDRRQPKKLPSNKTHQPKKITDEPDSDEPDYDSCKNITTTEYTVLDDKRKPKQPGLGNREPKQPKTDQYDVTNKRTVIEKQEPKKPTDKPEQSKPKHPDTKVTETIRTFDERTPKRNEPRQSVPEDYEITETVSTEEYVIIDGKRQPKKSPEKTKPKQRVENYEKPQQPRPETKNITETVTSEEYIIIDGKRQPKRQPMQPKQPDDMQPRKNVPGTEDYDLSEIRTTEEFIVTTDRKQPKPIDKEPRKQPTQPNRPDSCNLTPDGRPKQPSSKNQEIIQTIEEYIVIDGKRQPKRQPSQPKQPEKDDRKPRKQPDIPDDENYDLTEIRTSEEFTVTDERRQPKQIHEPRKQPKTEGVKEPSYVTTTTTTTTTTKTQKQPKPEDDDEIPKRKSVKERVEYLTSKTQPKTSDNKPAPKQSRPKPLSDVTSQFITRIIDDETITEKTVQPKQPKERKIPTSEDITINQEFIRRIIEDDTIESYTQEIEEEEKIRNQKTKPKHPDDDKTSKHPEDTMKTRRPTNEQPSSDDDDYDECDNKPRSFVDSIVSKLSKEEYEVVNKYSKIMSEDERQRPSEVTDDDHDAKPKRPRESKPQVKDTKQPRKPEQVRYSETITKHIKDKTPIKPKKAQTVGKPADSNKVKPVLTKQLTQEEKIAHAIRYSKGERVPVEEPIMMKRLSYDVYDDSDEEPKHRRQSPQRPSPVKRQPEPKKTTTDFLINEQIEFEVKPSPDRLSPVKTVPDTKIVHKTVKKDLSRIVDSNKTKPKGVLRDDLGKPKYKPNGVDIRDGSPKPKGFMRDDSPKPKPKLLRDDSPKPKTKGVPVKGVLLEVKKSVSIRPVDSPKPKSILRDHSPKPRTVRPVGGDDSAKPRTARPLPRDDSPKPRTSRPLPRDDSPKPRNAKPTQIIKDVKKTKVTTCLVNIKEPKPRVTTTLVKTVRNGVIKPAQPRTKPQTIVVEVKPTKPITKRTTVSTTINLKPKPKTGVKQTTFAPKTKAKPLQNGHIYTDDDDDDEPRQKVTTKKCVTTKSIIINNAVADEREIIVDLQRSKSSREETPDRVWPVTTEEDSGIPRYPDQISEPDEPGRVHKRVNDIPLTESEDVTEFSRFTELIDAKITDVDRVQETDECLLTVNEKVSRFLNTADQLKKTPKNLGPAPKVERPKMVVNDVLESDDCLLSVSDKVSKFITTAEKLSVQDMPERPRSPRCQNVPDRVVNECLTEKVNKFIESAELLTKRERSPPKKNSVDVLPVIKRPSVEECPTILTDEDMDRPSVTRREPGRVSPGKVFRDETPEKVSSRYSPEKMDRSPQRVFKSPERAEKVLSPERHSPVRKSPEKVYRLPEEARTTPDRRSVSPKKETPTTRESTDYTPKAKKFVPDNKPYGRNLPETETTPKSSKRPEDKPTGRLRSTESIKKARALFENYDKERPKQIDILSRPSVFEGRKLQQENVRKTLTYDDELRSTKVIDSIRRSLSPGAPTDGDIPHYMTQIERTVRESSPQKPTPTKASSPVPVREPHDTKNIPHYMTQLDRTVRQKTPVKGERVDRPESMECLASPVEENIPHYMTQLDRSLRQKSPHVESVRELEEIAKGHLPQHPEEGKPNKFGVVLRRTESGRIEKRRSSSTIALEVDGVKSDLEVEEIFDLVVLENLLEKTPGYDLRRRIRAQIRIVKKLIEEHKIETVTTKKTIKLVSPVKATTRQTPERSTPRRPTPDRKTETTETRSTYSYTEQRRSSQTQEVIRAKSPETKQKSPERDPSKQKGKPIPSAAEPKQTKRMKTPEPKQNIRSKSPKLFPTDLKKTPGSGKDHVDDKPEWVTQRNLKKVTERTVVTKKSPVKEEKPKRKSPEKDVDVITSSYGVGPTDENGSPLFGLRALRAQNKNEHTKVQGMVTHSTFYSENGAEPVGEVSVTEYSTDPRDLGGGEDLEHKEGVLSKTTIQKFGYKDAPSYKTLTDKKRPSEKPDELRTSSTTTTTKVTRRGSVKEMSQKFLDNAVETLKSEKQSSYPKAGLILRTSSFKDGSSGSSREGSPTADTEEIRRTVKVRTSGTKGETFLTNTSKVSGVQDVISRMKTEEYVEGDTEEDAEARILLNKFLGSQVLLSGVETQMKKGTTTSTSSTACTSGSSSTKRITKVTTTITENGVPRTTTRSYTHPITSDVLENIWDEQTLRLLLEQSTEYEERRVIRARLKQVMAEKEVCSEFVEKTIEENQSGNVQGESLLLPLLQGVLEAPEIEQTPDSGTESGEDLRSGLIAEVQNALDKLSACLCSDSSDITPERRDSLLQLVTKLQSNLEVPQEQGAGGRRNSGQNRFSRRRQRPNRHTVGVTSEELEDARRFMEEIAQANPLRKENSEGSVTKYNPVRNSLPRPYSGSAGQSGTSSSVDTPTTESAEFKHEDYFIPYQQSLSLDYDAGIYKKPLVQSFSLDYPQDEEIKKAVQQAAIVKVIKAEIESGTDEDLTVKSTSPLKEGEKVVLYDQGVYPEGKHIDEVKPDLILETNPVYRNPATEDKNSKYNSSKKLRMKRANTIDIPKPLNFYQFDDESDGESDANKRRSAYLALRGPIRVGKPGTQHVVPPFEPKTESDKKFLAFLNKQNQSAGVANKISLWDKSSKGGNNNHWQHKFGNIKTNFEKAATGEEKRNVCTARNFWKSADDAVSAGSISYNGPKISRQNAKNLQQMFEQKQKQGSTKLPWGDDKNTLSVNPRLSNPKQEEKSMLAGNVKLAWDDDKNVVTGSLKVEPHKNYKFVPQPLQQNKFSHNSQSAFKPIQKASDKPERTTTRDNEPPLYLYSPKSFEKPNTTQIPWGKPSTAQGERRVLSLAAAKFENPVVEEPKIKTKRVVKEKVAIPQTLQNFERKEKLPTYVAPQEQPKAGGSVRKLSGQYDSLGAKPAPLHQSAFASVPKSGNKEAQKYYEIVEGYQKSPNHHSQKRPVSHDPRSFSGVIHEKADIHKPNKTGFRIDPNLNFEASVKTARQYGDELQTNFSHEANAQRTPSVGNYQQKVASPEYNQHVLSAHSPDYNQVYREKASSQPSQVFTSEIQVHKPYEAQDPYSPSNYPTHDFPLQIQDYGYNSPHCSEDLSSIIENTPSYIETIESYEPNSGNPVHREVYSSPRPFIPVADTQSYLEPSIKPVNELPPSFHTTSPVVQNLQKQHHIDAQNPKPHVYYNNVNPASSHTPPKLQSQTSVESLHEYTAISSKVMSGPVSQQAVTVQQATPKSRNEHDFEQAFNLKNALQRIDSERKSPRAPNFRINDKPLNLESLEINEKGESIITGKFKIPMAGVEQDVKKPSAPVKFKPVNDAKTLIPSKGQILSKCDSWHQICQENQQTAKKPSPRASPNTRSITKSKSTHTLALPKQFEAGMSKDEMLTKKKTMEAYFTGTKSPQNISGKKSPHKRTVNRIRTSEKLSTSSEKVETTKKTFSEGPFSKTQVTTTTRTSTQQVKKPLSPFAKFQQLDKQNSVNSPPSTPKTPTSGGPLFKFTDPNLTQSASTIKERLLQWCRMKTKEYENVKLDNFSTSWADGLAFCALIHHFLPDGFDYHKLTPNNRKYNFNLAFQVAYEKADIFPLLDVDDMVATRKPDWKCVFTYVQSIYRRFKDED